MVQSAYNAYLGGYISGAEYAAYASKTLGIVVSDPSAKSSSSSSTKSGTTSGSTSGGSSASSSSSSSKSNSSSSSNSSSGAGSNGVDFGPNEGADWLRTGTGLTFEEYWGCGPYGAPLSIDGNTGTKSTASIEKKQDIASLVGNNQNAGTIVNLGQSASYNPYISTRAAETYLNDAYKLMNSIYPRFFEEWGVDVRDYYNNAIIMYNDAINAIVNESIWSSWGYSNATHIKAYEAERAAREAYEMLWTVYSDLKSRQVSAKAFNNLATVQERKDAIWIYLTLELNLDFTHAAAIMGNIAIETGINSFRSTQVQNDSKNYVYAATDGVGCGLLQWSQSGRKKELQAFARQNNGSVWDYDIQLDFMVYEGTYIKTYTEYRQPYSTFLGMADLNKATVYFCDAFEKAGSPNLEKRKTQANLIYDYYMMK